jgi:hypothetical protein
MADDAVVGRTGTVVLRIRGEHGPGEVSVQVRGGTETFLAYAPQVIEPDTVILVTGSRGARAVDVQPWG